MEEDMEEDMGEYDVEVKAVIRGIIASSEQDAEDRVQRAFQHTLEIESSRAVEVKR